jgi:DNA-binding transcriptional ArsR family regulator
MVQYLRMSAIINHDVTYLAEATREQAVATLRLLADGTRLAVLWQLRDGERSAGDLGRLLARPAPSVSQHLAKLRLAGLVATRRDGTTIYYRLATDHVAGLVEDVVAHAQHVVAGR